MKKLVFLIIPLLLTACSTPFKKIAPPEQVNPIENEVREATIELASPQKEAPKTIPEKPKTVNSQPVPKADEMTKEIDSLIDDLISGT